MESIFHCQYHIDNYATINQIMLKIIFGNVARKDHYNLSKSNTKKKKHLALKVTEKIKKKKKKDRSGWVGPKTNLRQTQILDLNSTQVFIQPAQDLKVGWVGLGWLGLCSALCPTMPNHHIFHVKPSLMSPPKKKKKKKKKPSLMFHFNSRVCHVSRNSMSLNTSSFSM